MHHQTAIGIMDEAYFCPRQQIIKWVNHTLDLNIDAIEDLGTGAVYCQLLDYGFGQRVPMQKINWKAKFQYEFINNLKVFQNTMQRLGITRKFDIEKLSKAKYQDNLETIQWLKRYIELNGNGGSTTYNALQRRNGADLYSISQAKKVLGNPFKTVVVTPSSVSNNINHSFALNQSVCSTTMTTTSTTPRARMSLKPRLSFVANKENTIPSTSTTNTIEMKKKKSSTTLKTKTTTNSLKSDTILNEIKKVLMTNDDSDSKISDIHKIIYGCYPGNQQQHYQQQMIQCQQQSHGNNMMEQVSAVESQEDEVLVF